MNGVCIYRTGQTWVKSSYISHTCPINLPPLRYIMISPQRSQFVASWHSCPDWGMAHPSGALHTNTARWYRMQSSSDPQCPHRCTTYIICKVRQNAMFIRPSIAGHCEDRIAGYCEARIIAGCCEDRIAGCGEDRIAGYGEDRIIDGCGEDGTQWW